MWEREEVTFWGHQDGQRVWSMKGCGGGEKVRQLGQRSSLDHRSSVSVAGFAWV